MIRLLMSSRPVRWLAAALAALLGIFGIVMANRRDAAQDALQEAENEALNEYVETRRRIDGVDDLDAAAARDRLRARKPSRDL